MVERTSQLAGRLCASFASGQVDAETAAAVCQLLPSVSVLRYLPGRLAVRDTGGMACLAAGPARLRIAPSWQSPCLLRTSRSSGPYCNAAETHLSPGHRDYADSTVLVQPFDCGWRAIVDHCGQPRSARLLPCLFQYPHKLPGWQSCSVRPHSNCNRTFRWVSPLLPSLQTSHVLLTTSYGILEISSSSPQIWGLIWPHGIGSYSPGQTSLGL